jgi:hypothetical protein
MLLVLVQFGVSGFVGRFRSDAGTVARGESVVVRSPRGLELGTALGDLADRYANQLDESAGGELLRTATDDDLADADAARQLGRQLLAFADESSQPVAFLDAEVTLDRRGAVLHALPWGECDLDPLLADLSDRFGLAVRMMDLRRTPTVSDPPEPKTSCGPDCGTKDCSSGGCGPEKGGCSTGSCSKGSVKSAAELTAYFADLRKTMEASGRVPLT